MAAEPTSISFDRAAGYYDATRRWPEEVAAAQTELLTRELATAGRVVEVAVGTGRIAIPLAEAGVRVFGADLSAPMLRRLVEKAAGAVPVAVADATRLPFADRAFGGVVVAHLLHLVSDWERVLDEVVRVLRPGGRLLINKGTWGGLATEIQEHVTAAAGRPQGYIGMHPEIDLDPLLVARGLTPRPLPEIANPETHPAAAMLDRILEHKASWTWPIDHDTLQRAVAETREWIRATHGDPETVILASPPVHWHGYERPA